MRGEKRVLKKTHNGTVKNNRIPKEKSTSLETDSLKINI